MTEGTKYHPLFEHLLFSGQGEMTMTFAEIESIIHARLPPSARRREEWWSNSPSGHSQARAWMRAYYKTARVDLARETVSFRLEGWPDGYAKVEWPPAGKDDASAGLGESGQREYGASKSHPLFGIWAGKVTLLPEVDYTQPAFDMDDAS
ncbi:DUF7662 domain-containing protein [Aquibium oceanicum]|uniref:DUF7662 domain-containing protein n=1 Tax=Aquibium oceanicum TaxID=1670800 RepID=A0A1L3SWI3_9HYPH|nr:hypothetical protein [Aquibium oceanicum]APH73779.1 hypothetical protein BSQ44_22150 [Aquibium oceanicum]